MAPTVRAVLLSAFAAALIAAACSESTPAPTATPPPTGTPAPTPTPAPPPSPTPVPVDTPTPTPTPKLEALFDYSRAVRLLDVAEYDDAILAFDVVIRKLPGFAQAYHGRGLAYYRDERLELALEDFDRAIELKPDFADAHVSRAVVRVDLDDTGKAIADLEMALSLYDRSRDLLQITATVALLNSLKE